MCGIDGAAVAVETRFRAAAAERLPVDLASGIAQAESDASMGSSGHVEADHRADDAGIVAGQDFASRLRRRRPRPGDIWRRGCE
jgi:hypothetical protein